MLPYAVFCDINDIHILGQPLGAPFQKDDIWDYNMDK